MDNHTKRLLSVTGIILIVSFYMSINLYQNVHYAKKEDLEKTQREVTEISREVGSFIDSVDTSVSLIAELNPIREMNKTVTARILKSISESSRLSNLALVNARGKLVYSFKGNDLVNMVDTEAYDQVMAGRTYYSDRFSGKAGHGDLVAVHVPVRKNNKVVGMLTGGIYINDLERIFKDTSPGDGYFIILDRQGQIIYQPKGRGNSPDTTALKDVMKWMHSPQSADYLSLNGNAYYCSTLEKTYWHLIVVRPITKINNLVVNSLLKNAFVYFMLMVFVLLNFYFLSILGRKEREIELAISYQKQIEHNYQQEQLASLGQMAAGVAHELRNPLTSIKGFTQLLLEKVTDTDKSRSYLEMIVHEVDRLNHIITSFLQFGKPQRPEVKAGNVNIVLDKTFALIDSQCLMKEITVIKELNPDLPAVKFDENQLVQVFLNLAQNAINALSSGKEGILKLSSSYDGGKFICIQVEDNGVGIAPENIRKIGTPFFTTNEEGTGLGLSICYQIIEQHQGRIDVQSELGKGTVFSIYLPIVK